MSATSVSDPTGVSGPRPWFPLPGFPPDAVPFAFRTTVALLLGYLVSFAIQLDSASSTGVCVAIVAQPFPGMAVSKAIWRAAGTVIGGAVALAMVSAFSQDRTMLLLAFALWLGGCTFVAALLRDFRSYGAVLCGYTVGIIAISEIDNPGGALMATLNRVAAILVGILCVALVNTLFSRAGAFETLTAALRGQLATVEALALDTLEGRRFPGVLATVDAGTAILALRTQAIYAAAETAGGMNRRDGAVAAIAGLLGMLSACRALAAEPAGPAARAWLAKAAAALRAGDRAFGPGTGAPGPGGPDAGAPHPDAAMVPRTPEEAFFVERAGEMLAHHAMATDGLRVLVDGGRIAEYVQLRIHHDYVGAGLSAFRTILAVAGGCVFCVLAGWPGATLLLVQQAAFTALLGMQVNPNASAIAMGWSLPVPALAAGIVGFVLLPEVSGFVPFALTLAPVVFLLALAGRHPRLQSLSAGLTLYFALLLAPSNTQSFDISAFINNVLVQVLAIFFMILAFHLLLPVSRRRRLFRIVDAIASDLGDTLQRGRRLDEPATHLLEYDRMAQAESWSGTRTPARLAVLNRMCAMIDLDLELRRAWSGLAQATAVGQAGAIGHAAAADVRDALLSKDPGRLTRAAAELMAQPGEREPVLHAVSGLYAAGRLLARERHALNRYGLLRS